MLKENKVQKVYCLIVSVGRSASTAIYKYFNDACRLGLPANKEPHHWCDIKKYGGRYDLLNDLHIDNREQYFGMYSQSEKVIDASVGYFFNIEEVICTLNEAGQKPKVIFLYRDPVSRANSLFNELEKKGLTLNPNALQDLRRTKESGLWWESYYDNVPYMEHFKLMASYFDEILLVNYDAFSANPAMVFSRIADFTGTPIVRNIDYLPVNSSAEIKVAKRYTGLKNIGNFLPRSVKASIKKYLIRSHPKTSRSSDGLGEYLPYSIGQYKEFRRYIEEVDVLLLKK